MTLQRLTLLPQAEAPKRVDPAPSGVPARPARFLPRPASETVEVTSITRVAQGGRWRTEAMRSYDRPVLLWFTRGQGRVTIAGRSGGYGAHSAIYLPAGTMHGFTVTPAVLGSVVRLPRDGSGFWPQEAHHLRIREVQLQRELTGLIDTIERETLHPRAHSDQALSCHASLLGIWFARTLEDLGPAAEAQSQGNAADRLTEAFTALVERDFRKPVGVQHFARRLGVTPTHLSRACRASSGHAALDILSDRRHFEACKLLMDTAFPIGRIAERSGFASAAYFTRSFRARTGRSPSEFRDSR